jgi:hypothetical protein
MPFGDFKHIPRRISSARAYNCCWSRTRLILLINQYFIFFLIFLKCFCFSISQVKEFNNLPLTSYQIEIIRDWKCRISFRRNRCHFLPQFQVNWNLVFLERGQNLPVHSKQRLQSEIDFWLIHKAVKIRKYFITELSSCKFDCNILVQRSWFSRKWLKY